MNNLIEAAQGISDKEQKLSGTELSLDARALITQFESALIRTEEFRNEASKSFFFDNPKRGWIGRLGTREVSFSVGDVNFHIVSKKKERNYFGAIVGQRLLVEISRQEFVEGALGDPIEESILLNENGHKQKGSVAYSVNTNGPEAKSVDTRFAVQMGWKMLARLSPQK